MAVRGADKNRMLANTRHVPSVHNARGSALHLKRMRRINARDSLMWKSKQEV